MTMLTLVLLAATAVRAADAPALKAADIDGKKIFAAKCAACHGKDGKGSPAMVKMLKVDIKELDLQGGEATKKTDAELTKIITDGREKMKPFKTKLKEDEIAAVLAYVRSLQAPAEPKAAK